MQLKLTVTHEGLLEATAVDVHPVNYTPVEAARVAKAIYQLAYSYTTNPHSDSSLPLRKAIGFFLMRPFAKLYPTEEVLTILNCYRALEFSFYRHLRYNEAYPNVEQVMPHGTTLIQRRFRAHRQAKRIRSREEMSDSLKNSMRAHHVSLNPATPADLCAPSKEEKEQWLSKQKIHEALYRKVLDNLVYYRSHAKFMKRLQICVHDFNTLLRSLPRDLHNYALVVPKYLVQSNHWVSALALPTLERKPIAILFPDEVKASVLQAPSMKHFVFFDDAIYSGRQMHELISKSWVAGATYTLIVPFYNEVGLVRTRYVNHYILGERMLRADEMRSEYMSRNTWRHNDSQILNQVFSKEYNTATSKVGVFFQHTTADEASTFLSNLEEIIPQSSRSTYS